VTQPIPELYANFAAGIYWIGGNYVSYGDIFASGSPSGGVLTVEHGHDILLTDSAREGIPAEFTCGISWTLPDEDEPAIEAIPIMLTTADSRGLNVYYFNNDPDPPTLQTEFNGASDTTNDQGTAVFGWTAPTSSALSLNGNAIVTDGTEGSPGFTGTRISSGSFSSVSVSVLAFYPYFPPADYPTYSGGVLPAPTKSQATVPLPPPLAVPLPCIPCCVTTLGLPISPMAKVLA
jgi:hypothetical protein